MSVCDTCRPAYDKWAVNPWQHLPQPKIYAGDGYGMTVEGVRDAVRSENKKRIEWRRSALEMIRRNCTNGDHHKNQTKDAA